MLMCVTVALLATLIHLTEVSERERIAPTMRKSENEAHFNGMSTYFTRLLPDLCNIYIRHDTKTRINFITTSENLK